MIALDENALICDLAETYHIFDYKQLPLTKVAVFACGLSDDSRIMMQLNDQPVETSTLLLAQITDGVRLLVWSKTEDGQNGKNQPPSIASALLGVTQARNKGEVAFDSGEDFKQARRRLIEGGID